MRAPWQVFSLAAAGVLMLFGARAVIYRVFARPPQAPASKLTATQPYRLTAGSSSYRSAALSADGTRVAYSSDQSGTPEIYVRPMAADAKEIQITHDRQVNSQPAWSPDGKWIAYTSRRPNGIWIVSTSGGVPRKVAEAGSSPAWAPDGKRLVYSTYTAVAQVGLLWTVNTDGTNAQPLTHAGRPLAAMSSPRGRTMDD